MQVAELDARIEAVLHRILPNALLKHLGPAMVQLFSITAPAQAQSGERLSNIHHHHDAENSSVVKYLADSSKTSRETDSRFHDLRHGIYAVIQEGTYLEDVTDEADLFECGLDIIQVTALVSEINMYLRKSRLDLSLITTKFLYENSTVSKLLSAIS